MWVKLKSWATWVADREIWPLALGVALATFTARWAPWGLALLAALWPVRWLARGRPTVRTPLDLPACLLVLTVPVSFYITRDPPATFVAVSRLLAGLALAYGLVNWTRGQAHLSLLALGLAGLALGLALYALVSVSRPSGADMSFIPDAVYEPVPLLVEDTVNPNMMAGALVMALPFPLALLVLASPGALPPVSGAVPAAVAWVLDGRWFRRLWFVTAALLVVALLVLTKSRGGWIAGGVVVYVLLLRRWPRLLWLLPVALLGVGLLAWQLGPLALLDALSSGGVPSGWESRAEVWSRAIYAVRDFPFTGTGAGTFGPVTGILYPFFLFGPGAKVTHAHNLLLQVAVDLGIPGLVAFLALLLLAFASALYAARSYRRAGKRALDALAWASLASLAGMLVHGMVDAPTWTVGRGAFVPWAVIGTAVALARRPGSDAGAPMPGQGTEKRD
jgi:putative inorganic carbon (HCO3(-)) transporter